jgi:hypothetical protein
MSLGALERQLSQIITPARSFSRFRNCENMIEKLHGENSCRQSRLCRLLGDPVAFAVVELLAENKELNLSEIARAVGRSAARENVLSALRSSTNS